MIYKLIVTAVSWIPYFCVKTITQFISCKQAFPVIPFFFFFLDCDYDQAGRLILLI